MKQKSPQNPGKSVKTQEKKLKVSAKSKTLFAENASKKAWSNEYCERLLPYSAYSTLSRNEFLVLVHRMCRTEQQVFEQQLSL